jgi:hypothetical protein
MSVAAVRLSVGCTALRGLQYGNETGHALECLYAVREARTDTAAPYHPKNMSRTSSKMTPPTASEVSEV